MTSIASRPASVSKLVQEVAEPFASIEEAELGPLLERIGDARVVLLGEATHGTSEFYRMRARITQELVTRMGFNLVAVEADWPDASWVDRYVRHAPRPRAAPEPFVRFPTWMWRNREVLDFANWLREHNGAIRDLDSRVGFYGLDLYSLYGSIGTVLDYLDQVDPYAAKVARERYACFSPWSGDPAAYGRTALTDRRRSCEGHVVAMLKDLLDKRLDYAARDGERLFDAVQNARLIANAEQYYRIMYYGSVDSWNLRDQHMFDTLVALLAYRGPEARAVVWEHNSHIGDAAATEMGARGEHNVGRLCRRDFGDQAYSIGFGTDHGTVAAASNWDEPMEIMQVRPSHRESYEHICHAAEVPAFLLPLREPARLELRAELVPTRLERAIGVVYRPQTEMVSHYFQASLPYQFDEYIWFDGTSAVTPLGARPEAGVPDTYPFGL
ncbi:MAG TPA: erythromycin esterase family protein [Gemmatimonadales bacterium]|nr:erythromycin esterase family protein [Gemmatimonadales bacterium]